MNILIVGEFSGFAKHLKNGFKKLGHHVTIVMAPDFFKKFHGDCDDIVYNTHWTFCGKTIKGSARLPHLFTSLRIRNKLNKRYHDKRPDLIIIINYSFLTTSIYKPGTPQSYIKKWIDKGAKVIMSECGSTPADCYNNQEFWRKRGKKMLLNDNRYTFLLNYSHAIVPTIYSYYDNLISYSKYYNFDIKKVHNCTPLPITIDKECNIQSCEGRKILIFHGIIRPIDKGTPFIIDAMKRLEKEMPDRVKCVARGGMPYDEYVKLFDEIDILVDQTYNNGWGMNAAIGAMNGKCVLAPCGPENSDNMGIPDIPFVRIGPDVEQIFEALKSLVLNSKRIDEIKIASRRFVEEYCECSIIAQKYLDIVF